MEKVFKRFRQLKKYLKLIFIVSVTLLVVVEVARLQQTISSQEVGLVLQSLGWGRLVFLILIGLLAVSPMVGYDYMINRMLGHAIDWKFLLPTSWSINTLNNLLGMGGLVNTGLRLSFYRQEGESSGRILQRIAQVLLYVLCGLSLYAALVLLLLGIFRPAGIGQYWVFLLVGALYFPLTLVLVNRKQSRFFRDFALSDQLVLAGISFLEWTGVVVSFLAVGSVMGLTYPLIPTACLLIVAMLVGILSFIPGGLGSFDLVVLAGMAGLGIDQEAVVAWILLFRLNYYMIPFSIGLVFLLRVFGQRINDRFDGIPATLLQKGSLALFLVMVYGLGIFLIMTSVIPEEVAHIRWLHWVGDVARESWILQAIGLILGYLYLLLARLAYARSRRARAWGIVLALLTLIYWNIPTFDWRLTLYLAVLLILWWALRQEFYRQQFVYGYEQLLIDALCLAVITFAYLICLSRLRPTGLATSSQEFLFIHFELTWLQIVEVLALVLLAYYFMIKTASYPKQKVGQPFDLDRYLAFIDRFGGNENTGLAFLRDKELYWYQVGGEDVLVFQYQLSNNKCDVMGSPHGDPAYLRQGLDAFLQDLDRLHLQAVFYEVDADLTLLLHEFGFDFIKFGEAATVDLRTYTISGKKNRGFRNIRNQAQKEGMTFEIIQAPHDEETLAALEEVSTAWLGDRLEKGFSLGFFDRDYLNHCEIAVVRQADGEMLAFANLMPNFQEGHVSVDLMRYHVDKTAGGIMDYLFIELFLYYQGQGLEAFGMGMAPLANVGDRPSSFVAERIANFIYRYGTHFYSFEGLRNYKKKFRPKWEVRYTCYANKSCLLASILSIYSLTQKTVNH